MKVMALDFGSARTGVAVSDDTGTIASPVGVVERAMSDAGLRRVAELVAEHHAERIVVGLPVSLDSREHDLARLVRGFLARLATVVDLPVETYDERFTTVVAQGRGGTAAIDARAAAVLLEDYLRSRGG
jgi:putative holliday junction resolvase